ncbi:hypothetical protein V8E53_014418 [Lactarius tabidus]
MQHNLQSYHTELLCIPSYCASPLFLSGVGWQTEDSGDMLVDKDCNANTVAIVVGHVLDHQLFVTLNGNYSKDEFSDFSTTKFLFLIGKPTDTPFTEDFDKGLECFSKIQNQITSTPKQLNFITTTGQCKSLQLTRNIFHKRISDVNSDSIDETTETWPVKSALKPDLDKVKFGFEASPLPVYVKHCFIKPLDIQHMLKGALVEVYFELRHFCI